MSTSFTGKDPHSFRSHHSWNLSLTVVYYRVVVQEETKPMPRYIVYFRPREEDQWVLFFNEKVTFASHREVFEDTFRRSVASDNTEVPLKSPCMLIYMKVSMLGELLG